MAPERARQLALAAVTLLLVFLVYRIWPGPSGAPAATSNQRGASGSAAPASRPAPGAQAAPGAAGQSGMTAPDVHLESLDAKWPKPGTVERNLFRFKPKAPPPAPPAPPRQAQQPVTTAPAPPPGPPPLAPITLKFIGIIESPTNGRKIAVLSDGRNPPFQGVEGDIIEGRYRILKIGVESIEIAYADGRGRQTIRLTGS
jgi:hypothetical protein